jgi:hypothetical protein
LEEVLDNEKKLTGTDIGNAISIVIEEIRKIIKEN